MGDDTDNHGSDDALLTRATEDVALMLAINESLIISNVRQQEHMERLREAERRSEGSLGTLMEVHEGLQAAHEHLRETHAAVQAAYEREHRIAQALQRPLTLEVPEDAFPGLSVATLYSAASAEAEVGGDFYDAVPLSDGRVAFIVGDASGKGVMAAARAMEVKDVLRAYLRLYPFYPALTLTRVSDYLCDIQSLDDRAPDTFFALALVVVNVKTSEAIFAWAGIEAPILARAGGPVERLKGPNLPLGVTKGHHYGETTVSFRPGDTVLLSTDGLSEARRGTDFLGSEGVDDLARRSLAEPSLWGVGAAILAGARAFAGGKMTDDACLVLARRL